MGRPRLADRDDVIRDAAFELLVEVGYDRLRVQDVADRAGVGLATIYRRWSTKQELAVAALDRHEDPFADLELPADPVAALRTCVAHMATELSGKSADFFPGLIGVLREEPALQAVFNERVVGSLVERFGGLVSDALGGVPDDLDLRVDAVLGVLLHRVLITRDVGDAEGFADRLVALVLAPR